MSSRMRYLPIHKETKKPPAYIMVEERLLTRNSCIVLTLAVGSSLGFSIAFILLTSSDIGRTTIKPYVSNSSVEAYYHPHQNRFVADELKKQIRILCWIMTCPENHDKKAKHVKDTWGKRCDKLIFISSQFDETLPTVNLSVPEGKNYLWGKTKEAFRYVYEHHRKDAEWFLKADDDTYVIIENLRYLLADYDTREPLYVGCKFHPNMHQSFMYGGAGYVLSRGALHRFVNMGLPSPHLCRSTLYGGHEDAEIGVCLSRLGVQMVDTRDHLKRGRFFPFKPEEHLSGDIKEEGTFRWRPLIYAESYWGRNCCSEYAVSFHHIPPEQMYEMDYFIYNLQPYGISYGVGNLPNLLRSDAEVTEPTKNQSSQP